MKRGNVTTYSQFAVGQRVLMNTLKPGMGEKVLRSATAISQDHTGTVVELWCGESGAQMTVRTDDGDTTRMCINPYGQQVGGFGFVKVLRQEPMQMTLLRPAA